MGTIDELVLAIDDKHDYLYKQWETSKSILPFDKWLVEMIIVLQKQIRDITDDTKQSFR